MKRSIRSSLHIENRYGTLIAKKMTTDRESKILTDDQAVRDPLARLRGPVRLGLIVMIVVSAAAVAITLLRVAGVYQSSNPACVSAPSGPAEFNGGGGPLLGLRSGTTYFAESFNVCTGHPSAAQVVLSALSNMPGFVFLAILFYLAMRSLGIAAADAIYAAASIRSLRTFGWVCLVGGLVTSLGEAGAKLALFNSLIAYRVGASELGHFWSFPWATTLVGLGLFVLARTVRSGATMSEDLEGTV